MRHCDYCNSDTELVKCINCGGITDSSLTNQPSPPSSPKNKLRLGFCRTCGKPNQAIIRRSGEFDHLTGELTFFLIERCPQYLDKNPSKKGFLSQYSPHDNVEYASQFTRKELLDKWELKALDWEKYSRG